MCTLKFLLCVSVIVKYDSILSLNVKAHFPASKDPLYPRIQMTESLPNLKELTVCTWLKPYVLDDLDTLLSYATLSSDNQLLIALRTKLNITKIEFHIVKSVNTVTCSRITWKIGEWYHLCVSVFTPSGSVAFYLDGILCEKFENILEFKNKEIPTGGILIIGQEQDGLNSKFDNKQSWYGDIADLHIWNEKLSEEQIREAGICKGKRKQGNVFSWMKTKISVLDNVIFSETELCNP
ncbi:C-reactive protein 1.4-like [Centruroides vittatus]|uniref:C-reactive protein 1.4-like n=1 Tax=Centruroides vittatus TaxID=120091 RepID=UPI0035104C7B